MNIGTVVRGALVASQLFNNVLSRFVPTYKENAKTDGLAGMVGGAAAGTAAIYAWATGLDATTTTGLIAGAGYLGIQAGGMYQHWRDEKAGEKKAAAKARIDASKTAHDIDEDRAKLNAPPLEK